MKIPQWRSSHSNKQLDKGGLRRPYPYILERMSYMKITLSNEVLSVEDGIYTATIDTVQSYGEEDGILMKLQLEDGRTLVEFYRASDLGSYPWSDLFRALNTDDTDDLIGKAVEITVENKVSKSSGNSFCNVKRVKLLPKG